MNEAENTDFSPAADGGNAKPKRSAKKIIQIAVFVLLNVVIIGYTAYSEFIQKANDAPRWSDLKLNGAYLFLAFACFLVSLLAEVFKYHVLLKKAAGVKSLKLAFEVYVLGKYYDSITPSGFGGQPFQIYYLKKNGISNGPSATIPVAGFLSTQIAFVILALAMFILNGGVVLTVAVRIAAYIGLLFYMMVPGLIILLSVAPVFTNRLITFIIRLISKLRIIKDPDKTSASVLNTLGEYRDSISSLRDIKHMWLLLLLSSLVYQASLCSIPFFVLLTFGGSINWFDCLAATMIIYAAITFIPTPGNTGAAEGSFYALFSFLTTGYIFWAMLIWRFFCYYLFIALGIFIFIYQSIANRKKRALRSQQ